VRLVRLERQQSRVADDIRAALASLGRGSTVIGGIALIGVGSVTDRPIEAVVLLPHGVIIVIGVDLPDPALRLEAPLGAPWKADGWPLVADDDAVNPATEALDLSQACEQRIAALVPGTAPVGTIIAVGPYVETVDQPAGDLAGPVRVLHPTPTTMLAATVSLATAHRPRSVDQVRALIRGLAPDAPEFSDEVLLGEGFSRYTDDSPPESLWDSGPAVPAQVAVAATGSAAGADSPAPASAAASSATSSPVAAAAATPAPATSMASPAPAATAASGSVAAVTAAAADPGSTSVAEESARTENLPAPAEDEPKAADSPARPVFPGTETAAEDSGAERTENLSFPDNPAPTSASPAEPATATASSEPGDSTPPPPPSLPTATSFPRPRPTPTTASRTVRWLPLAAIGLLVLLVVGAVVVVTGGDGDDTAAVSAGPPTPATQPPPTSTKAPVESLQFSLRAAGGDQRCASHAFGDAQASLQQTSCSGVKRASYAATVDGRAGAVTIGIVDFPDAAQAAAFKAVADTPGGGGILDLATETGQWGAPAPPRFENAAYASKLTGTSVRLVQAVWAPGPSTPDDPGLARAAKAALDLPVQ
jgi:hypothetical protein